MSKWLMRGHFGHLHFKTFLMTPRILQCEVFWALLSNSKHSGVPEGSKSPTLGVWVSSSHLAKVGLRQKAYNCDFPQKLQIKFNLSQTPHNCLHKGLTTYYKRLIRGVGFEVKKIAQRIRRKNAHYYCYCQPHRLFIFHCSSTLVRRRQRWRHSMNDQRQCKEEQEAWHRTPGGGNCSNSGAPFFGHHHSHHGQLLLLLLMTFRI